MSDDGIGIQRRIFGNDFWSLRNDSCPGSNLVHAADTGFSDRRWILMPAMLTGLQLRAARKLLGLHRSKLAERMGVPTRVIRTAESVEGECPVTIATARRIQIYLERHGIELLPAGAEPMASFSISNRTEASARIPTKA